jgi:acetyl/propionyl-CoA carboxylase alpha subunit
MAQLDEKIATSAEKLVKYGTQKANLQAELDRLDGDLAVEQKKAEDVVKVLETVIAGGVVALLSAPAVGVVRGLTAKKGQSVQAGDVLLRVQRPDAFTTNLTAFQKAPVEGENMSCDGEKVVVGSVSADRVEIVGPVKAGTSTCLRKGGTKPYTMWVISRVTGK